MLNTKVVYVSKETKEKLVESYLGITLATKATSVAEIRCCSNLRCFSMVFIINNFFSFFKAENRGRAVVGNWGLREPRLMLIIIKVEVYCSSIEQNICM
jgi:hypothetical protein